MARRRDGGGPRLVPVDPGNLTDARAEDLEGDGRYEGLRIAGDATGAALGGLALDECVLDRVRLDDAAVDGARLTDTVLDGVTATALRGRRFAARDVRLDGCRVGAAEWAEAEWDRVHLTACRIDYLGLADARLTDVLLSDCTIGELDLRGAAVTRVALERCRVASLSLHEAALQRLDLRGADLERIDGVGALRGAVVSGEQLQQLAPLLAEAFGIAVEQRPDRGYRG